MASRKNAIRDETNIRLRCSWTWSKKLIFLLKIRETDYDTNTFSMHSVCPSKKKPCVNPQRLLVYIQHVPVCTGTMRTCWNTCALDAGIHGDVLNVHKEAFSACHTTPHRTHTTTQDTTHHNTKWHTTRHHNDTTTTPHDRTIQTRQRQDKTKHGGLVPGQCASVHRFTVEQSLSDALDFHILVALSLYDLGIGGKGVLQLSPFFFFAHLLRTRKSSLQRFFSSVRSKEDTRSFIDFRCPRYCEKGELSGTNAGANFTSDKLAVTMFPSESK